MNMQAAVDLATQIASLDPERRKTAEQELRTQLALHRAAKHQEPQ